MLVLEVADWRLDPCRRLDCDVCNKTDSLRALPLLSLALDFAGAIRVPPLPLSVSVSALRLRMRKLAAEVERIPRRVVKKQIPTRVVRTLSTIYVQTCGVHDDVELLQDAKRFIAAVASKLCNRQQLQGMVYQKIR